jgi:hypothetical protein
LRFDQLLRARRDLPGIRIWSRTIPTALTIKADKARMPWLSYRKPFPPSSSQSVFPSQ